MCKRYPCLESPVTTHFPHPLYYFYGPLPSYLTHSVNIQREVHYYLQGPFIAHIFKGGLAVFDVSTRNWKFSRIREKISIQPFVPTPHIMLSSWEVFILAYPRSTEGNLVGYILDLAGAVKKLPELLCPGQPGLYLCQDSRSILAFGGGSYHLSVCDVQRFSLTSNTWEMLDVKMNIARYAFTPCQHLSSLYLAGHFPQVESYSLKTETFNVLWEGTYPSINQDVTFLYDEKIFLTEDFNWHIFDLKCRKYTKRTISPIPIVFNKSGAVFKGVFISVWYPYYFLTDLKPLRVYMHKASVAN